MSLAPPMPTPALVDADGAPPPRIALRLLGQAAWRLDGQADKPLWHGDAALLARLALEGRQARTVLCALLWPDASQARADASLRQRTSRLNRAAEGAEFVVSSDPLALAPKVHVDLLHLGAMPTAQLLAAGPLLAGIDLGHKGELDDWLTAARAQVAADLARHLTDRAEALERDSKLRDALPLARRVVELQPLAEHGWRRLMRLHYLRNDRAAAQDVFWRLTTLLRDELGIRPSAETLQLMQTVEAAAAAPLQALQPVPVSVLRPPVLVGRGLAWQAMALAWQRRQPFVLVGEAGLGKSRLLEDFLHGQPGVVGERGQPGDEASPYALLGRALWAVARAHAPAIEAADRAELARLHPGFGPVAAAPAHERVLWQAIERLLAAATAQGLQALVLDDLHCADRASLDALRWLAARPELVDLRLGLATRPEGLLAAPADAPLAAWLQDSHRPVRIDLQPLTPQELTTLLASLALPTMLDASLAAQLYRHAGGHPLFTLATLQDALSRGAPLGGMSGGLSGDGPPLPRPSSVQSLLDARLAALPAAALDLLRVAAVAGPDLRVDRAARLLGCSVLALTDSWALLEAANVLRGEAFSHDLVHDSALRAVPQGVRQALHRQVAGVLAEEASASPARLAWHWQQGECWADAGHAWHAAGQAAYRAGRLVEAGELFERAADAHHQAGDQGARFEALHARLEGLRLRHGGQAVLAALPAVEALADTRERRLRCRLARAEALGDGGQWPASADELVLAVAEATLHPTLLADALALQAEAQVRCGQTAPAHASARAALDAAQAAADPLQRLHALEALSYVCWSTGQLGAAVDWQQQAATHAEAIGRRADAATNEGQLTTFLASIGDVPATYAHALLTRQAHRQLGLGDNSTVGIVNHRILGAAAAALGRFDEAWDALHAAVAMAGPDAAPWAQARARLSLANLWLTLGRGDQAQALLAALPGGLTPGLRMQAEWLRAGAAELQGQSPRRHLQALGKLANDHADLPLVQSAWFEWSFQGDAAQAIARLEGVRRQCEADGLHGTARSLRWRELARWLDIDGPQATATALAHARVLAPFAATGCSAKCHPPQTWQTLWLALGRAGDTAGQRACADAALRWLDDALPSVPAAHRHSFLHRNPVHRWWRAGPVAG